VKSVYGRELRIDHHDIRSVLAHEFAQAATVGGPGNHPDARKLIESLTQELREQSLLVGNDNTARMHHLG
jgi:hypothetical protein